MRGSSASAPARGWRPRVSRAARASAGATRTRGWTGDAAPEKPVPGVLPPRDRRFRPFTPPPDASEFPAYAGNEHFRFEVLHRSSKSAARVGRIHTPHGTIDTPGYVAVGTMGALKHVPHSVLRDAGLDLMFANTYHLMLQPGPELVAEAGGLRARSSAATRLP